MSKTCEKCGKKPMSGNLVSHSHRKTRTRWLPNLQKTSIVENGVKKSVKICTRCMRTIIKHATKV